MADEIIEGPGFAVGSLDAMGEGFGFRKVRHELGVTAFGVNAIVLPPKYRTNTHTHEQQEELYVCLDGEIEMDFGDAGAHTLRSGDMARVDASTPRSILNHTEAPATYLCIGGKDGYVGRDGQMVEGAPDPGPIQD
jgi:uncharacterized cupin superfamily protein